MDRAGDHVRGEAGKGPVDDGDHALAPLLPPGLVALVVHPHPVLDAIDGTDRDRKRRAPETAVDRRIIDHHDRRVEIVPRRAGEQRSAEAVIRQPLDP